MEDFDHRILGQRLDLFHLQEDGPGMVFWHPRGWALYRIIEDYIRRRMRESGFLEIKTPQILARSLWERSGHWEKFGENMFSLADGEREFAVKPMSCPGHLQVFNSRQRSYRELPLRYAEFGACHRNEPSGALQGLMRTRAFNQDDAHVLCRLNQIGGEVVRFSGMLKRIYRDFGFDSFSVGFSTRPALRAGSDELWDRAESMLASAAEAAGLSYDLQPGEGAFYGPKLEFILSDRQGRQWQCGTIQLDFVLPGRLGAEYVDENNERQVPIIIHHAVLGSLERFIGMLLEHCEGKLPLWLSPEQIVVASVSSDQADLARNIHEKLLSAGLRSVLDDSSDTLPRKVVRWRDQMIPCFAAVGRREAQDGTVNLRLRDDAGAGTAVLVSEIAAYLSQKGIR